MYNNFYIYVDTDGKMPILSPHPRQIKSHPFYIQYSGNKPVAYHGPLYVLCSDTTKKKIYDYSTQSYVSPVGLKRVK